MPTTAHLPDPSSPTGPVGPVWPPKAHPPGTAERLAAEQGTTHTATVEHIESLDIQLWDSDAEFDAFLDLLRHAKTWG